MNGKELGAAAESLLNKGKIPYVNGGSSTSGMDCQGLVEWAMKQCGVNRNWKGSNDMWRNALAWKGTPEECKQKFGGVPVGAGLFIVEHDGGEVARGYHDNEGNAGHVGLKIGTGRGIHASSSRGCVAESVFKDKTIPNGGWNMIGLWKDADYSAQGVQIGTQQDQQTAQTQQDEQQEAAQSKPTQAAYKPKYKNIVVKYGTKGGAVREVQQGLRLHGYDVAQDGDFGPLTLAAVKDFQQARGLEADGIVGRMTWAALEAQ